MDTEKRFAAIDIGSNAVRLLLSAVFEADEQVYFKKISLIRMPIRLGAEAFTRKAISGDRVDQLVRTMAGFRHLIDAYQPLAKRACATSAMREARNGVDICARIRRETGIAIQVIDGREEARIIFANRKFNRFTPGQAEIYVDVGGGSTEITLFSSRQTISASFNIGTIRLLEDMVTSGNWQEMKKWVRRHTADFASIGAIGSGGNINKVFKLAKRRETGSISRGKMKKVRDTLRTYTVAERITRLGLKPDRADVILPALKIYLSVMKWAGAKEMRVPHVGLADGIVRQLYYQYTRPGTTT